MVMTDFFDLQIFSMLLTTLILFIIFFGVGLIIPNSLSHALRSYQMVAGTAGSIFGGGYYCLIAGFTLILSVLHNGTAQPLPLYIVVLGTVLACASQMISLPISVTHSVKK